MKTVFRAVSFREASGAAAKIRYESHDFLNQADAEARAAALGFTEVHQIDFDEKTRQEVKRTKVKG